MVWHAGVRFYNWFETKQCIRSNPTTPVMSRFGSKKPASLVAPKARRPPPLFIQQRAGLSSNYEIEHFPDPGSLEEQPVPPESSRQLPAFAKAAVSLYPHHMQVALQVDASGTSSQPNVYRTNQDADHSEPLPIRDWPKRIGEDRPVREKSQRKRTLPSHQQERQRRTVVPQREPSRTPPQQLRPLMLGQAMSQSQVSLSESARAKGKSRMTEQEVEEHMLERSSTKSSSRSHASQKATPLPLPPLPPLPSSHDSAVPSSYSRSRPTGPRTRTSSVSSLPKHRPPPLDLSFNRQSETRR